MTLTESQIKKFAAQNMIGETAFIQECHDGAVVNFDDKNDAIDYFLREPAEFEMVLFDGAGVNIAHKTPEGHYCK